MACDYRSFKRFALIALIIAAPGTVAAPVAVVAAPLVYQSDPNASINSGYPGDRNPCDPRPGHRQVEGKGSLNYCDNQPKYVLRGNDSPRRPGSSAFGLQFDTEGY